MAAWVLALMARLAVGTPGPYIHATANAIATVAHTRHDAGVLVTLQWREPRFSPRWIPFGITCCYREGMTLEQAARIALDVWHRGERRCHSSRGAFRYFNTGECLLGHRPRSRIARLRWTRGRRYALNCLDTLRTLGVRP